MTAPNSLSTHLGPIAAAAIVAGSVLVATLLGLQKAEAFRELKAQQIHNEAIDNCARASRYVYTETTDNLTKVTEEPSQNFYAECLKLKEIK